MYNINPTSQPNIPYIFSNSILYLQVIHLSTFRLKNVFVLPNDSYDRPITYVSPFKFGALLLLLLFRKFLKAYITYNFPQTSFNPTFSYVIVYSFIQLHINVRRDLVPKILLHFIIVPTVQFPP